MALHLFEGLMKWEDSGEVANGTDGTADSGKLVPGQAESYEKTENDDGTVTYTSNCVTASNGLMDRR